MQKLMTTTATLIAGAAFSAAIILACGNSPGDADAATCDCPAAEPPLAGRIQVVEDSRNPGTSGSVVAGAACESAVNAHDWTLLGGGCMVDDDNASDLILYNAGPGVTETGTYICNWVNPTHGTIDAVKAYAICLVPAE